MRSYLFSVGIEGHGVSCNYLITVRTKSEKKKKVPSDIPSIFSCHGVTFLHYFLGDYAE